MGKVKGRNLKIIGGDFNTWSLDWGNRVMNTRGEILIETFAELKVVLTKVGLVPTFREKG